MNLRTQLGAVVALVTTLGVGATGGILVLRSHRHATSQLIARQQLEAQAVANTIRNNIDFLDDELVRLEAMEQINFTDNDNAPEERLLHDAQASSAFFTHTVMLVDAAGKCLWGEPPRPEHTQCDVAGERWFQRVRATGSPDSWVGVDEQNPHQPVVGIVVPVVREGRFVGALEGVMAIGPDPVITPVLRGLKHHGQAALVDLAAGGEVIEGPRGVTMKTPGWSQAYQAAVAEAAPGTWRGPSDDGVDSLFAFAPVGLFNFEVVCQWRWKDLDPVLSHELAILLTILAVGGVASLAVGILFSQGLSRPLRELAVTAGRLASGDFDAARSLADRPRGDEIGALHRAFRHMATSLGDRDLRIRDDLEEIRRIATEKDRLYKEVHELAASLEQRVEERTRELRETQAQLVSVERFAAMGKTAAVLAHEVKNALNGIGMSVDVILADVGPTPRAQRLHGQLRAEIARLSDLTENLLAFSRAPRLARSPEDINDLVRRSIQAFADTIRDGDIDLSLELAEGGRPLIVPCDGHKIQGAVMNLVKNAIEAVAVRPLDLSPGAREPSGDIARPRIRIETRRVRGPRGEEAVVEIADSGSGLSPEARAHLFEPFHTTKPSGTGLGLATAHRYLEAHGGRVEVDPGPGPLLPGACVRLFLPLAELAGAVTDREEDGSADRVLREGLAMKGVP